MFFLQNLRKITTFTGLTLLFSGCGAGSGSSEIPSALTDRIDPPAAMPEPESTGTPQAGPTDPSQENSPHLMPVTVMSSIELGASQYVAEGEIPSLDRTIQLPNLDATILVIYSYGSLLENTADVCETLNELWTPIDFLRKMHGKSVNEKTVLVYAFCTPSLLGDFNAWEESGEPKAEKRAHDIGVLLNDILRAGMSPNDIYLMGFSTGGWSSFYLNVTEPNSFDGIIAINPAFAGTIQSRIEDNTGPAWQALRDRHQAYISEYTQKVNALVLKSTNDEFETNSDLSFLVDIGNTEMVTFDNDEIGCSGLYSNGNDLENPNHQVVHDGSGCFDTFFDTVINFLEVNNAEL